jgi:hypothetical protein
VTLDTQRIGHHIAAMRPHLILLATLALAACSGDPRSLGITGPGTTPAASAEPAGMDSTPSPGAPSTGTYYGPTNRPVTGASGFWGYN